MTLTNHEASEEYLLPPAEAARFSRGCLAALKNLAGIILLFSLVVYVNNALGNIVDPAFVLFVLVVSAALISMNRKARREQLLPEELRSENKGSKVLPPKPYEHVSADAPTLSYYSKANNKHEVMLSAEGVWISPGALLRCSWKLAKENLPISLAHGYGAPIDYTMHIQWSELKEWRVQDGWDDGPAHYALRYHDGQCVTITRPYREKKRGQDATLVEPPALDFVRSVGQCPVRLLTQVW